MDTEKKWSPTVGKTAWYVAGNVVQETNVTGEKERVMDVSFPKFGHITVAKHLLFPTAEAALASIKIYDLEGNEVVISRVLPIHVTGVCSECKEKLDVEGGVTTALEALANIAYKMEFPQNPEGETRLQKAQGSFAKLEGDPLFPTLTRGKSPKVKKVKMEADTYKVKNQGEDDGN